jgi:RNA polymerase sigma factor (sigma-70 family)
MPPQAEGFAARLVLGPALRTQPDRRLVALVRDGYEAAFEEIVRRYGKPLTRYAGAIVGARAEDVTQDAFSKALLALRREGAEIELRPWLFRIVRNTALNDLRDSPPSAEALAEEIAGGGSPAEVLERREELVELMRRLGSLPEPQRAAIVMRELEGLSHEEIAAALGLTGGAARQAIYRARRALREGLGLLLPLPVLRMLIDHGGEAVAAGAGAGGAAAASGALGGAGAGMALKAGVVTAVLAGSVGAGVALHDRNHDRADAANPVLSEKRDPVRAVVIAPKPALRAGLSSSSPSGGGERVDDLGHGRDGSGSGDDDSRSGHGDSGQTGPQHSFAPPESGSRGRGPRRDQSEPGDDHGGTRGPREPHGEDRGGEEGRHSGPGRSPRGDDGHGGTGPGENHEGNGGHRGGGSGHVPPPAAPVEEEVREASGGGSGSGRDDPESTLDPESGNGSSGPGRGGEELP